MRGKRIDKEYISSFIESSVMDGKSSLPDLLEEVSRQIGNIDKKIKEVEFLKKERTKLLDVKEFLGKNLK
jgi:hypothetical protein